ncbi:MAG: RDD family protein [Gammaproteobacteria bacterium]
MRRLAALVYDSLVVIALLMLTGFAAIALTAGDAVPAGTPWFQALLLGVTAAFFCSFWITGGQTLGMRAWRLRLIKDDGQGSPVTLVPALIRFFAAWLSLLPLGLGFFWIVVDRRHLAWHDRISGTRVVNLPRPNRERSGSATG